LVVAAANGEVVTWHPITGQQKRQPISSSGNIVAVAAGEGRAAALSDTGDLFVWQLDSDDPPSRLDVPVPPSNPYGISPSWSLALAPDGCSVAVTCGDGIVHAGSIDDELRAVYTHPPGEEDTEDGHTVVIRYTPAGRLLIAGNCTALRDNRWWYTSVVTDEMNSEIWRSPPQRLWSTARALSPDGRMLLTGNQDGTLLVWLLDEGATSDRVSRQ
jgi:WD40 repeat protein